MGGPRGRRRGFRIAVFLIVAVAMGGAFGVPVLASRQTPAVDSSVPVMLDTNPTGLQLALDGSPMIAPQTFNCQVGSTHSVDTSSPQAGGSSSRRWVFSRWSDGYSQRARSFVCDVAVTYVAEFIQQSLLTFDTSPPGLMIEEDGTLFAAPQAFWWEEGTVHSVMCVDPPSGWTFQHWDDGRTENPRLFVTSGPEDRTCIYGPGPVPIYATGPRHNLTVTRGAWDPRAAATTTPPVAIWWLDLALPGRRA